MSASIASLFSPPINTRSGFSRSLIAVPSDRNSGLERTSNFKLLSMSEFCADSKIFLIFSAVLTGKVLFSTTIVLPTEYLATCLAHFSTHLVSLA